MYSQEPDAFHGSHCSNWQRQNGWRRWWDVCTHSMRILTLALADVDFSVFFRSSRCDTRRFCTQYVYTLQVSDMVQYFLKTEQSSSVQDTLLCIEPTQDCNDEYI